MTPTWCGAKAKLGRQLHGVWRRFRGVSPGRGTLVLVVSEQEAHVVTPAARPVGLQETKVSPRHTRADMAYVQRGI